MQHLLAFTKSMTAASTNEDCTGVYDGWATLTNSHYQLPVDLWVYAAYAQGATITTARFNQPSLRSPSLPYIVPLEVQAAVVDDPAVVVYPDPGLKIPKLDELAVETSNGAAGAEQHYVFVWLGDGQYNVPAGSVITVRATASITAGNKVWGAGTFTLTQGLAAGRYSVIGMDVIGANLLAARLAFADGGPKPGVLARSAQNLNPHPIFRGGRLGEMGQFEHTAIPGIELFGTAAPTTQEIYLDLIKIR